MQGLIRQKRERGVGEGTVAGTGETVLAMTKRNDSGSGPSKHFSKYRLPQTLNYVHIVHPTIDIQFLLLLLPPVLITPFYLIYLPSPLTWWTHSTAKHHFRSTSHATKGKPQDQKEKILKKIETKIKRHWSNPDLQGSLCRTCFIVHVSFGIQPPHLWQGGRVRLSNLGSHLV